MFSKIIETTAGGVDLAVIKTGFGFYVRYGLQVSPKFQTLSGALLEYQACLRHSLAADLQGEEAVA